LFTIRPRISKARDPGRTMVLGRDYGLLIVWVN
jgi:hypothetical protein